MPEANPTHPDPEPQALAPAALPSPRGSSPWGDRVFRIVATAAGIGLLALILAMVIVMWRQCEPARRVFGLRFLFRTAWNPVTRQFGALAEIYGTAVSTIIAVAAAVPLSFGIALFLSELAPKWLRAPVGVAIELLAAVPSIVYGMWGLFVLAPIMAEHVQPWIQEKTGEFFLFSGPPMGIGLLTAGLVLALMILPFITSVLRDVFLMTPTALKESAYGMGATTWEVVWNVVVPYGRKGVIGGIVLGLGRALGETMAVTFVIGNAHALKTSLFAPGSSIASTLANEFTEADSDLYLASLVGLGLVLFLMTFFVLGAAQLWLHKAGRREGR